MNPVRLYDYHERLERSLRKLSGMAGGSYAVRFIEHLASLGLSVPRLAKYAAHLSVILRLFGGKELDRVSREDVERAVAWINRQSYTDNTRRDLKLVLKKFIQYVKCGSCGRDAPLPPEVSWIKIHAKNDSTVQPSDLLTQDQIKALLASAKNPRDKAMICVMIEAALRPGELLTMRVGNVEFRENYCIITVRGKTGIKRIPLIVSHRPLLEWLEKHPRRSDIQAPLWLTLTENAGGEAVSYWYMRKILRKAAKRAGISKRVWPYLLRHTTLTSLAKVLTEQRLSLLAGWVQGSRMPKRYVHFSGRDLEDAILEIHGLKPPTATDSILKIQECPRCGMKNQPENMRCSWCGMILDRRLAEKLAQEEHSLLEKLTQRVDRLEQLLRQLLPTEQHSSASEDLPSASEAPSKLPRPTHALQAHTHSTSNPQRNKGNEPFKRAS